MYIYIHDHILYTIYYIQYAIYVTVMYIYLNPIFIGGGSRMLIFSLLNMERHSNTQLHHTNLPTLLTQNLHY